MIYKIHSMPKLDAESIIGGALALIASFAWRDAITETIDTYYPVDVKNSKNVQIKFMYAIVITMFVFLLFTIYIHTVSVLSKVDPELDKFMQSDNPSWRLPSIESINNKPSILWRR